jgi:hypothetical protein
MVKEYVYQKDVSNTVTISTQFHLEVKLQYNCTCIKYSTKIMPVSHQRALSPTAFASQHQEMMITTPMQNSNATNRHTILLTYI